MPNGFHAAWSPAEARGRVLVSGIERQFSNGARGLRRTDSIRSRGAVRQVEDVEQQRLQDFRVGIHALEVEALEPAECERVLRVVEDESVWTGRGPLAQALGHRPWQDAGQARQRPVGLGQSVDALDRSV